MLQNVDLGIRSRHPLGIPRVRETDVLQAWSSDFCAHSFVWAILGTVE